MSGEGKLQYVPFQVVVAQPPTPAGAALRARLEEMESRRRSRIRLALSLRQPDYDALSFPEISVAAGGRVYRADHPTSWWRTGGTAARCA